MKKQKVRTRFSNCTFSFWDQFNWIKVFPFFQTTLDSSEISSKSVWRRKFSWFRQNLIPRVASFYIRTKFRLKNSVTTVHLLQCKTIFLIHLCFRGRNLLQIKEHPSWEPSVNIKKMFFWFVYTCLHSSRLV